MEQLKEPDYMVHVVCMTYNQSPYIVETLNGFTLQQTDFPFVCVVIDDASTDGEQEVIKQYVSTHFDLDDSAICRKEETDDYILTFARHKDNKNCYFAVLYLKYNHYSIKKSKIPYYERWIQTKYRALCEGDDYWTDPYKLQKQVDYLESHPECGMVYTQAKQYEQETGEFKSGWAAQTDFDDLLVNANKVMTLTTCFRQDLYLKYQKEKLWQAKWLMGDYPMWLYFSKFSDVKFLDDVTGVYRILKSSASHNPDLKKMIAFMLSVYDIRCFFANRYGYQTKIKGLAHNVVNDLFRLSVQKDKNLSETIFKYAKENGVLSSSVIIRCIFYSTKMGRGYHRRKYPYSATMY